MPWLSKVKAVLDTYYPGQNGGRGDGAAALRRRQPVRQADADVPGERQPDAGRRQPARPTPASTTRRTTPRASSSATAGTTRTSVTPLFPFGYGLSYTTFGFANLAVGPRSGGGVDVSFDVTNTGSPRGRRGAAGLRRPRPRARRRAAGGARAGRLHKVTLAAGPDHARLGRRRRPCVPVLEHDRAQLGRPTRARARSGSATPTQPRRCRCRRLHRDVGAVFGVTTTAASADRCPRRSRSRSAPPPRSAAFTPGIDEGTTRVHDGERHLHRR